MILSEICKQLGIYKSRGYSILHTLRQFGFIEKDPETKAYSLGSGLFLLSNSVLTNMGLRELASPLLKKLSWQTNNTAIFGAISGKHVFIVAKEEGGQEIGVNIKIGQSFPLTWGAHGKAITAFLPERERKAILANQKMYYHGHPSKFDKSRFEKEMARCRKTGFALDMGEVISGIRAVASAVLDSGGKPVGSILVVGTFPEEMAEDYGIKVAEAGRELSKAIGAGVSSA